LAEDEGCEKIFCSRDKAEKHANSVHCGLKVPAPWQKRRSVMKRFVTNGMQKGMPIKLTGGYGRKFYAPWPKNTGVPGCSALFKKQSTTPILCI
jgi:hypothetical protein